MGLISLGYDRQDFHYEWYTECKLQLTYFSIKLEAYNKDASDYTKEMDAFSRQLASPPLYRFLLDSETERLRAEGENLQAEADSLESEWEQVRGYAWEQSYSPVTRVRVYW